MNTMNLMPESQCSSSCTTAGSRRHAAHSFSSSHSFKSFNMKQCIPSNLISKRTAHIIKAAAASVDATIEDKWVASTISSLGSSTVDSLRSTSLPALATLRMPNSKVEEYRFTDVSSVLQRSLTQPPAASKEAITAAVARHNLKAPAAATIVIVDGIIQREFTKINSLPDGVYVGDLAGAPKDIVSFALGAQTRSRAGPFATLNSALTKDVAVVHIPANKSILGPIHILYFSSSAAGASAMAGSAPRLLAVLEEGSAAEIIEEYAPLEESSGGNYLIAPVAEFELDDTAMLKHSYVELEAQGAAHMKTTLVNQGKESSYLLTEARQGGQLSRHDLGIEQLGEATSSTMRSFLLAGEGQTHDLHSKLKLDHPSGEANQLHKCIVSHATGRGVFDGNVKVNRLAQKTDAQQISRNLLLVPKATVNVKPNLQIIADDVKCTHGCAISDLEEEELFYLRARGIDVSTARQMLVYSFGKEVVNHLRDQFLMDRVEKAVNKALDSASLHWTYEEVEAAEN